MFLGYSNECKKVIERAKGYAMTSGGPSTVLSGLGKTVDSTSVAGYYLYKQFDAGNYGYAAAISYIMLIITLGITYIQQKLAAKKAGAK